MTIVKLANGNIEIIKDNSSIELLPPNARLKKDASRNRINIIYGQNNIFSIALSEVDFLQVEPAAAVAFTGNLDELFDQLKNNFFYSRTIIGSKYYKVYAGYFFQIGTNDPAVTVIDNTIGNITWTRSSNGEYYGTLAGAFPDQNKVFFVLHNNNTDAHFIEWSSQDEIYLYSDSGTDGTLRAFIEIRVYE